MAGRAPATRLVPVSRRMNRHRQFDGTPPEAGTQETHPPISGDQRSCCSSEMLAMPGAHSPGFAWRFPRRWKALVRILPAQGPVTHSGHVPLVVPGQPRPRQPSRGRRFAVPQNTAARCRYPLTTLTCNDSGRRHKRDGVVHLIDARPGQPPVDIVYIDWHRIEVFKGERHRA